MKRSSLSHEFVSAIPDVLRDDTLYVCIDYATAAHKCCCGCGLEVVTPITPTDWQLTFDGETVSLHPSIGNWSFPCRSHYWIDHDKVRWAGSMSDAQISHVRASDRVVKDRYFGADSKLETKSAAPVESKSAWKRFIDWLLG